VDAVTVPEAARTAGLICALRTMGWISESERVTDAAITVPDDVTVPDETRTEGRIEALRTMGWISE
jgi:hypothetical protein